MTKYYDEIMYDSIIGDVISGLIELRRYIIEHEPSKVEQVKEIQEKIKALDYYMAYGEEPTPSSTIAGVDFSESLSQLENL